MTVDFTDFTEKTFECVTHLIRNCLICKKGHKTYTVQHPNWAALNKKQNARKFWKKHFMTEHRAFLELEGIL